MGSKTNPTQTLESLDLKGNNYVKSYIKGKNMKAAIVTGASSGIGFEISKVLIDLGYKVYGIGRDFSKINYKNEGFIEVSLDITKTSLLCEKIKEIKKNEDIYILVNGAGVGYFGPHEELDAKKIHEMTAVNIEAPMIISQILLRDLKKNKGYIINISSITAKKQNTYGCAYGATKAALTSFSLSLFEEARKYGVKVVALHPDITKTNFYRNADFKEGETEDSFLNPCEIAEAVKMIIKSRNGLVVTDLTIRPQRHMIKKK